MFRDVGKNFDSQYFVLDRRLSGPQAQKMVQRHHPSRGNQADSRVFFLAPDYILSTSLYV